MSVLLSLIYTPLSNVFGGSVKTPEEFRGPGTQFTMKKGLLHYIGKIFGFSPFTRKTIINYVF